MKKLFYLLLFISFSVFSQSDSTAISSVRKTTLEEYNYLSKGYKDQLEKGLDMKKGYYFKPVSGNFTQSISTIENKNVTKKVTRKNIYKLLYRENESLPCAILMITERLDNNVKSYYCIPSYGSDMWDVFSKDFFAEIEKEMINMSELEKEYLKAKYSYYFNSLKMISYCLTTDNLK